VLRRHRIAIAACFAAGAIVAVVIGRLLTPIYRATAVLMVGGGPAQMVGMEVGTLESYYERRKDYLTQPMLITSRSVLRQAVKNLRARGCDEFEGAPDEAAAATVLRARLTAKPVSDSRLIEVSYEGPDEETVAVVANEVVTCYKEQSRVRSAESTGMAASWFEERLPKLMRELTEAEDRLYEFQKQNSIVSQDKRYDIVSQRLAQLNQDVTKVERERIALEARVALIGRRDGGPDSSGDLPFVIDSATLGDLRKEISALEGRKAERLIGLKPDHPEVRSFDTRIARLHERQREEIADILAAERNRLEALSAEEKALRKALAEQQAEAMALSGKMVELAARERNVDRIKQIYEPLLERSRKVSLSSGLESMPVIVWDPAEQPTDPAKPRKMLIALVGAVLGLLVGLRLAFLLDRADARVRSPEDIEVHAGLRSLNVSPHLDTQAETARAAMCSTEPKSTSAEAFRSLRTEVLQSADGRSSEAILVTSAVQGEGKTFVATNLAAALAQLGRKVLLVDADMRRSKIHKDFGLDGKLGLSSLLADGSPPNGAAVETGVPNLTVLVAGDTPQNPAELLSSPAFADLLEWAKREFTYTVIDSPPLLAVTDARLLARLTDRVLLVARAGVTQGGALARAQRILRDSGTQVVGAVLNDVRSAKNRYGYGHYSYYGYGSTT
jgi:capsular exopolysaccharide synthesis family protein